MKTPPLSLRSGSPERRLAALEKWTDEPAAAVAATVAPGVPSQAEETGEGAATATLDELPWRNVAGSRMSTYRVPERVYLKLKWLGETTYGTNATKILCDVLEPELDRMLRERGIEP